MKKKALQIVTERFLLLFERQPSKEESRWINAIAADINAEHKRMLRTELIAYDKWCATNYKQPCVNTADRNVDEYLKSRER